MHRPDLVRPLVALGTSLAVWLGAAHVFGGEPSADKPFNFEEASRSVPRPRELYAVVKLAMLALSGLAWRGSRSTVGLNEIIP